MRRLRPVLILAFVAGPDCANASASDRLPGPMPAVVERVIDGDTIEVRAAIWLDQEIKVAVRIDGVDAPELFRPRCPAEKAAGERARDFVESFFADRRASLSGISHDKYAGRVLASVRNAAGADLAAALLSSGNARNYGTSDWCLSS